MRTPSKVLLALSASVVLLIAGCGGGDAAGSGGSSPTPQAAQLSGTAAVGAALANAPVDVKDASGAWPCVEQTVTTTALGSYTCTLKAGESAPFFVVVTDPTGDTPQMVSISTTTPAAGATLTLNVTPLTTAIVGQLAGGDALAVVKSLTVDPIQLAAITRNVIAQLQPVLTTLGAVDYDPFTTSITAATPTSAGNTADNILDVVKVVNDPNNSGALALTTISDPTPVPLSTATTAEGALSAPSPSVADLAKAAPALAQAFDTCFALPTSSRVLATDTSIPRDQGGASVTQVASMCQDLVSDTSNAGHIPFLHNGYSAGQLFYGWLTSDSMTGAQFSVPEVMAYTPAAANSTPTGNDLSTYDHAVVNLRFIDGNGNPGNQITVAALVHGSATADHPSDWWLVGNQDPVDINVRMTIRRIEQLNPNGSKYTPSSFLAGFQALTNPIGPGSTRAGAALHLARVSGPGIPAGGLVYITSPNASQTWMDLWNKTGSLTTGTECGNGTVTNCPNFWLQHTVSTSGTGATQLGANPNAMSWAAPSDGFDPTQFVKGAVFTFELFYGSNTGTADVVVKKTLLTDLVPATQGVNLPWNTPGPKMLAALDPNGSMAGAQANLTIDWIQNPSAQQIGSGLMTIDTAGTFGPQVSVARGATSLTFQGQTAPAFSATQGLRSFILGYRMSDGSNKSEAFAYNAN